MLDDARSRGIGIVYRQGAKLSTRSYPQRCPPCMTISTQLVRYIKLGRSLLFGFPLFCDLDMALHAGLFERSQAKLKFLYYEQGAWGCLLEET